MIYDSQGEDMDKKSVLDEMNPAVRLLCLLLISVSFILADSVPGCLFALAFFAALVYLSQLGGYVVGSVIKRLHPLLIFVFLLRLCFLTENDAFFSRWGFTPSLSGALSGLTAAVKITEIAAAFEIFNTLTEPTALIPALSFFLRPLSLLGISHEQIAITVSSSFWFFSFLKKQAAEITELQKNSGVHRPDGGRRFDPAGKLRLMTPLLYEGFHAARERATLLEARGVPEYFRNNIGFPTDISVYDYCAMTVSAAFFAVELIIF